MSSTALSPAHRERVLAALERIVSSAEFRGSQRSIVFLT